MLLTRRETTRESSITCLWFFYLVSCVSNFYISSYFACRIDVNMKNSVYCTAVANGGENEWDFAWDRYQASNVASEKNSLLGSMACTKEVII